MRILVLAVHYEVTGARYIADAFKRLGHDVRHYGQQAWLRDAWGVDVPKKYIWEPDYPYQDNWRPDLIIIADTNTRLADVPTPLIGIPVIKWSNDNHVRNVREDGIAHYFLAHYHGQAQPVTHDDETWLPCATDATVFTPSPIPWEQRKYDICCVGVMYPQRSAMIDRLKGEGFKVFAGTGLVYDEYREAYHNSRASLCISSNGDLAQRVFETAGMGCLVITDLLRDLEDDSTREKLGLTGYVSTGFTYDNPNNIAATVDQCRRYLRGDFDPMDVIAAKTGAETLQRIVRERHTWDKRAQVVVDWYNKEYGVSNDLILNEDGTIKDTPLNLGKTLPNGRTLVVGDESWINGETIVALGDITHVAPIAKQRPYLNLGCGKTHLPSAKPAGHEAVDAAIYDYPLWVNVDKVQGVGADKTFDLFTYPWPLEDNSFDGALLAHIVEHIPHEIKLSDKKWVEVYEQKALDNLRTLQDGWYAFFSELYRVLTPGAVVHNVSPYGWSDGGITDPSHTRYLTINTFTHSMTPDVSDGSTFQYNNGGINFKIDSTPIIRFTPYAEEIHKQTGTPFETLVGVYLNMVYDFYIKLRVVK